MLAAVKTETWARTNASKKEKAKSESEVLTKSNKCQFKDSMFNVPREYHHVQGKQSRDVETIFNQARQLFLRLVIVEKRR